MRNAQQRGKMSERTQVIAAGIVGIASLVSAGCDQLPEWWPWGKSKAASSPSAASASATTQNPQIPMPGALPVPTQERVAVVNQALISTTDVELAVRELKQLTQAYGQTWAPLGAQENPAGLDLTDVMNNLIDTELKTEDAKARGVDRKTDVQRRLAYLERGFYAREWDELQRKQSEPSDDEVHKLYEQLKAELKHPERIHVRQIVANTLAEAEAVRARAVQGAVFAQLAIESSVGPGKDKGGDVGWYVGAADKERLTRIGLASSDEAFFPQLESVAFALEKEQISQPVKGPDGRYYLVQLEEREPAKERSELEVRDGLKELLRLQRMGEQLDQLRKKGRIERFPERLGAVDQD